MYASTSARDPPRCVCGVLVCMCVGACTETCEHVCVCMCVSARMCVSTSAHAGDSMSAG